MFDLFIVILYLAALTALGLRGGKNVKSASDFTAVSARYGAPVLMMSLSASFIGGGFSSGNAANAFSYGIGSTVALFGFSLSMLVIGLWLAPGVARFSGEATVGGVMRRQYGRRAGTVTGFFSFLCCAGVVGAQMEAMGRLFGVLLGLPAAGGVLLGGAIILLYTTFGGLQSVIIADIIQFVLLALGMPLLVIMAWLRARTGLAGGLVGDGGPAGWALATIPSTYWNPFNGIGVMGFVSLFLTLLCGEALAPPYMQRLLIGKNPRTVARATVASAVFSVPFFVLTGAAGLLAYVLQVTPEAAAAMPALIRAVLPVGLRGFVMAAMVSIMLSAADSFLNSAAVGVMCDIVLPAAALTEKAKLRGLRGANAVTGLAA
ncbi:MAG: sodium:solute symporter family protein, partial [Oscillospiraceae bacterium]|nr:sodium:solute symporter family protein [Oscillospiraceae bacterium]